MTKDSFDIFHSSEKSERALIITEGYFFTISGCIFFLVYSVALCGKDDELVIVEDESTGKISCILFSIYMGMLTSCFICNIVFFYRIKKYNISGYDCSDSITNELVNKGTEDNYKQIFYISINFYLDIFQIVFNCLAMLIGLILMVIDKLNAKHYELKELEKSSKVKTNDKSQNFEQNYPDIPLNTFYPDPN